jgi:DNA-binding transcriptional ArsR family regulator
MPWNCLGGPENITSFHPERGTERRAENAFVPASDPANLSDAYNCDSLDIINYLYKIDIMQSALNLDAAFAALADPTRRAILARLAQGEANVMDLAEPFEITQPAISQHLKVLERAGLVTRRVDGARRPRKLSRAGFDAMDQWLAMLRKALEANYNRLDDLLANMQKQAGEKQ